MRLFLYTTRIILNFSYWEYKTWLSNIDFAIIGSGIVGLNCALHLKKRFPNAKIVVLERGILPNGASTKNAGFACFGSISEILEDLNSHSEEEVLQLIQKRKQGLQLLREQLGDSQIDYLGHKGYELFTKNDEKLFNQCVSRLAEINTMLLPVFGAKVFSTSSNQFGFKNIQSQYIVNHFEGQIDTGKMMQSLLKKVQQADILILNHCEVDTIHESDASVTIETKIGSFNVSRVLIATNGFAAKLGIPDVKPARAQVLITEPIQDLHIKGTFHLDRGYYYFRNIDNRILLGGGRHLDFKTEETTHFGQTKIIQQKLETLLNEVILPNRHVTIAHRWSGIMGVGNQKKPIVEQRSSRIFCGVRQGGMGVAIGSLVGKELAALV